MYISLNPDKMVFMHKHDNPHILANLASIECPDDGYCIFPIDDASGFRQYSDASLAELWKNSTGKENIYRRAQLQQALYLLCQRFPETEAGAWASDNQAAHAERKRSQSWRFVSGATRPAPADEDWVPVLRLAEHPEDAASVCANDLYAVKFR